MSEHNIIIWRCKHKDKRVKEETSNTAYKEKARSRRSKNFLTEASTDLCPETIKKLAHHACIERIKKTINPNKSQPCQPTCFLGRIAHNASLCLVLFRRHRHSGCSLLSPSVAPGNRYISLYLLRCSPATGRIGKTGTIMWRTSRLSNRQYFPQNRTQGEQQLVGKKGQSQGIMVLGGGGEAKLGSRGLAVAPVLGGQTPGPSLVNLVVAVG